jgi:hypothetical protein
MRNNVTLILNQESTIESTNVNANQLLINNNITKEENTKGPDKINQNFNDNTNSSTFGKQLPNTIMVKGVNGKEKSIQGSSIISVNTVNQTKYINNKKNNLFINHLRVDKSITIDSQKSPSSISGKGSVNNKQNVKNNKSFNSSYITPSSVKNTKNQYKNKIRINNEEVTNNEDTTIQKRFYSLKDKPVSFGENGYPSIKLDRISDRPTRLVDEKQMNKENNLKVETSYYISDHLSKKEQICVENKEVGESLIKRNNNHHIKTNDYLCNSYKDTLQLNNLLTKTSNEKSTEFNGIILFYKKT